MMTALHSWLIGATQKTRNEKLRESLAAYFVVGPQDVEPLGRTMLDTIRQALDGGITFLQLRAKPAGAREILEMSREISKILVEIPEERRPLFVIDDRVDVAAASQREGLAVDGVHVGQSDLPVDHARAILFPGSVVGLSAATPETIVAPDALSADYLGIGAYHSTISKADAGEGLGEEKFADLVRLAQVPTVAIGGVSPADAPAVARAGGDGLCVISDIARADDVRVAAAALVSAWKEARSAA